MSPCVDGQVEQRIDDGYQVFQWSHDLEDAATGSKMAVSSERFRQNQSLGSSYRLPVHADHMVRARGHFILARKEDSPVLVDVREYLSAASSLSPERGILAKYQAKKCQIRCPTRASWSRSLLIRWLTTRVTEEPMCLLPPKPRGTTTNDRRILCHDRANRPCCRRDAGCTRGIRPGTEHDCDLHGRSRRDVGRSLNLPEGSLLL